MKHGMEKFCGLRYKMRMIGVHILGAEYLYGVNMSVANNTQHPESTVNNTNTTICYYAIHEAVATGEI